MRLQAIARDEQRNLVKTHYAQTIEAHAAKRLEITESERSKREEIVAGEEEHRRKIMGLLAGTTKVLSPLIILVCAVWVGMLAWVNVRERRSEIGLLRALGKGSASIATLFLGKAAILGVAAGAVGSVLGFLLARWLASGLLDVEPGSFTPSMVATVSGLLGTPLVAAMASYLPTLAAIKQDPAVVLMD